MDFFPLKDQVIDRLRLAIVKGHKIKVYRFQSTQQTNTETMMSAQYAGRKGLLAFSARRRGELISPFPSRHTVQEHTYLDTKL
jgi:hypothetical protein